MRAAFAIPAVPRGGGAIEQDGECPGTLARAGFVADGSCGAVDDVTIPAVRPITALT